MTLPENWNSMRPRDKEHYKNMEFKLWWDINKDKIEKRDQHSFSGMVRLSNHLVIIVFIGNFSYLIVLGLFIRLLD
jgi:hypothetical protein